MRLRQWLFLLAATIFLYSCAHGPEQFTALSSVANPTAVAAKDSKVDFHTQIKPILQQRCQPCHFSGGVMYQKLPFDRPETIKTLGVKLFTRLKDEKERELIRQFLSQ